MTEMVQKSGNPFRSRPLIFIAAVAGVTIHLVAFLLVKIELPQREALAPAAAEPAVRFIPGDGDRDLYITEQAALFDSAPLFLPTRWNSASNINRVASLEEETELFQPFEAELTLPDLPLPQTSLLMRTLPDISKAAESVPVAVWKALGRKPGAETRESGEVSPAARDQVSLIDSAGNLFQMKAPDGLRVGEPDGIWHPVRIQIQMLYGKMLGPPLLIQSSETPEWDALLLQRLADPGFGAQLPDGYWQVEIGP